MPAFKKWIRRTADVASCTALLLMSLLVFVSVIARYLFNSPLAFSNEIAGYLLLGIVMLGLLPTAMAGAHIRIEFLRGKLRGKARKGFQVADRVLATLYVLLLFSTAAIFTWDAYQRGSRAPTVLETPVFWPAAIMPLGILLLGIGVALGWRSEEKDEASEELERIS